MISLNFIKITIVLNFFLIFKSKNIKYRIIFLLGKKKEKKKKVFSISKSFKTF